MIRQLRLPVLALAAFAAACSGTQPIAAFAVIQSPAVTDPTQNPPKVIPTIVSVAVGIGNVKLDTANPANFDKGSYSGITGLTGVVEFNDATGKAQKVSLKDLGNGAYGVLNSGGKAPQTQDPKVPEDPNLTFVPGTPYKITLTAADGTAYVGTVTPKPQTKIKELEDGATGVTTVPGTGDASASGHINQMDWKVGADFTVTRDPTTDDLAFVAVSKVNMDDPTNKDNLTWANLHTQDQTALIGELVRIAARQDSDWKKPSYTAPGATAFPAAGAYGVALSVLTKGNVSSNLAIGSMAVGATGYGAILNVK